MRIALVASVVCMIALATANVGIAVADEHDNHRYVHHEEWRKGTRLRDEDWKRGEHIDYREQHLRAPPRGYEWRLVDGNYVLAAVATGVIASVVAASMAAH